MDQQLTTEELELLAEKQAKQDQQDQQKRKLARLICRATQKTNYRCDRKCDREGECAYCLVMAEELLASGVAVPTKCKNCRYKFANCGHDKRGCPLDGPGFLADDDFCSIGDDQEETK